MVATGHYRNGILLAPLTADAVARCSRRGAAGRPRRPSHRRIAVAASGAMTSSSTGEPTELADGATVADAVAAAGVEPGRRGVAVAVDGEVVPRGEWAATELRDGQRVEVVGAIQGG